MKNKKVIALVGTIGFLIAGFFSVEFYMKLSIKEEMNTFLAKYSDEVEVSYRELDFNLLNQDITLSDITIKDLYALKSFYVKELSVMDIKFSESIPTELIIKINGITWDMKEHPFFMNVMQELDYDKALSANIYLDYHYQPEKQRVTLQKLLLSYDELGELEINFVLDNVLLNAQNSNEPLSDIFQTMVLNQASIIYREVSFADRIIKLFAKSFGLNIADFKQFLITNIEQLVVNGRMQNSKNLMRKIQKFIVQPQEIALSVKPDDPLTIQTLFDHESHAFLEQLNMQ